MGAIVAIHWDRFTISTEIRVVTYGTFITVSNDVGLIGLEPAERTVTEDAMMFLLMARRWGDDLIDWDKPMSWVNLACTLDAG